MDRLSRFSWLVLVYNVAVILWGAVVRATGSGAGCGAHWPLCDGAVIPRSPRLDTLIELSHRLSSGLALILVVALAVWVFRARPAGHPARRGAVASVLLILAEAGVGAGLVLFRLVAGNESMARALFMAAHLLNTFLLLAALTLTAHGLTRLPGRLERRGAATVWLALGLVSVALAGASGAVAALGDTLFPARSWAEALAQDLSPTGHLLVRLRLLHPAFALASGLLLLYAAWRLAEGRSPEARGWSRWVIMLAPLQLGAGVLNVLLLAPVWLQVFHLLLADLLWISLVSLGAWAHSTAAPAQTAR
jgi:heme a synthase